MRRRFEWLGAGPETREAVGATVLDVAQEMPDDRCGFTGCVAARNVQGGRYSSLARVRSPLTDWGNFLKYAGSLGAYGPAEGSGRGVEVMYAVIRTGGKQHRVSEGERLKVEKLQGDVGGTLKIDDVLLIGGEGDPKIGQPRVSGAVVTAKIVAQDRGKKIEIFKKQRRKGFRKKAGHRQPYTELEITGIET